LITHVHTTQATVHEAQCTQTIQQQLVAKNLAPAEQLVDAAYVDADLLVQSQSMHGITLVGPTRPNSTWQAKTAGAYTIDDFVVDWQQKQVSCPEGKIASSWHERIDHTGMPYISVVFSDRDCNSCPARARCTRKAKGARRLKLQPHAQYLALQQARQRHASEVGRRLYHRRAGIEGTISQGVRLRVALHALPGIGQDAPTAHCYGGTQSRPHRGLAGRSSACPHPHFPFRGVPTTLALSPTVSLLFET
jgi:transposase